MKVVFFGSAEFGLPTLEHLLGSGHEVVGVVTTPPRPRGRGLRPQESPIARYAQATGLRPILTPEDLNAPAFTDELEGCRADAFVVVAYRILPESVFTMPPFGTINVHASLLPRYRGPAPIQRAIEHGERRTGVTVFRIDTGIDTGAVLLRRGLPIGPEETTPQLYERLSRLGAETLVAALEDMAEGRATPSPQDSAEASRAPKLRKEEGELDWRESATALYNKIRAFKPYPGTWALVNGKRLCIEWARVAAEAGDEPPGTVRRIDTHGFEGACGRGALRILSVRPEGRGSMEAAAYVRGARLSEGMVLG